MKFNDKTQQIFTNAGWSKDRNISKQCNKIKKFNEAPDFLKSFLTSYGNLLIETKTENAKGTLDFGVLFNGLLNTNAVFPSKADFGLNLITYPLAYYHLDNASLECDADGRVYMVGDFPTLMSENFIEGIEKVIMEDYSNTLEWDFELKKWVE